MSHFASFSSRPGRFLLLTVFGGFTLMGCGKDPEGVGKELAEVMCDCAKKGSDQQYERDEKLASEIEDGKIKSGQQYYARQKELSRATHSEDSTCMAKFTALSTQMEVDFVKQEDRQTISNAAQANFKQCKQEREADEKSRKDLQLQQLVAKLPYMTPAVQ